MTYLLALILFSISVALQGVQGRPLARPQPLTANTSHEGLVYNCVNFYDQPAFSHPLLKHLVPKVRPNSESATNVKFNKEDGSCADGTVPILSRTGEDPPPRLPPPQEHCYAVVRTKMDGTKKQFFGTEAHPSVNQPEVQGSQWSAARLKLASGITSESESIEAGWMVFPRYFKDNDAHLYVKFKVGESGCFNTDCPGFVQVSRHVRPGSKPSQYATIGGLQYSWDVTIEKSKNDGNWHLYITSKAFGKEAIGYWPGYLFKELKYSAAQAEWGGEINNPGKVNPAPDMGSGLKSYQKYAAFFNRITVLDATYTRVTPQDTEEFMDCRDLYVVRDDGDTGGGRSLFYGGKQTYDLR